MNLLSFTIFLFSSNMLLITEDPIAEFENNFPVIKKGFFSSFSKYSEQEGSVPTEISQSNWIDSEKFKRITEYKNVVSKKGETKTVVDKTEIVMFENGRISVSMDSAGKVRGVVANVKQLSPKDYISRKYDSTCFSINGIINYNDYKTLSEILSLSKKIETVGDNLNGIKVIKVTSVSDWGKHTLWLDPARSYLPLRVLQEKKLTDKVDDGKILKDWAKKDKDNEVILPKHLIQQIDSIKLDKVNGRDYISEYKIEISMEYSDNSKNKIDELVKLYNIKIVDEWQQDPFVVTSRIPNGMKIGVPDDRPFNYIWKDGRPTKVTDEDATDTLDKVEFKTDNNNSRLRIILFASCVVILILILTLSKIILRKRY